MSSSPYEEVFPVEEVAKIFKLSVGAVRNLIREKELPALRIGKQYRIPKWAIDRYFNQLKFSGERSKEKHAIDDFVKRLVAECKERVHLIKLFGSKARGEFGPTSDIDILVVVDREEIELWDKIQGISSNVSLKHDVFLSVEVMDKEHFSLLSSLQTGFIQNIQREGIDLWKAA